MNPTSAKGTYGERQFRRAVFPARSQVQLRKDLPRLQTDGVPASFVAHLSERVGLGDLTATAASRMISSTSALGTNVTATIFAAALRPPTMSTVSVASDLGFRRAIVAVF